MSNASSTRRPPVGAGFIEMQWNDFYQNLLLKGEVQELIIHAGVKRATAILHPGICIRKLLYFTLIAYVTIILREAFPELTMYSTKYRPLLNSCSKILSHSVFSLSNLSV